MADRKHKLINSPIKIGSGDNYVELDHDGTYLTFKDEDGNGGWLDTRPGGIIAAEDFVAKSQGAGNAASISLYDEDSSQGISIYTSSTTTDTTFIEGVAATSDNQKLIFDDWAAGVWIGDGDSFYIANSTETDYAQFSHDGTDFNTALTNTTDWNITGFAIAGKINLEGGLELNTTAPLFQLVENDATTDRGRWQLFANSEVLTLQPATDAGLGNSAIVITRGATANNPDIISFENAETGVHILDGAEFRIFDSANTDSVAMSHDGTDFNFDFTNTTDVTWTGYTNDMNFPGGTRLFGMEDVLAVADTASDAATVGSYNSAATQGIMVLCDSTKANISEIKSYASDADDQKLEFNDWDAGIDITGQTTLKVGVFTDAQRPSAGTAGRIIFNSTDGNLNIDDGTNWILPDGTTT